MEFKSEYKKSAEMLNPSAEAMERMKANILAKAAQPEKKSVPFRRLTYIGGTVAACAVLTIGAVSLMSRSGVSMESSRDYANSISASAGAAMMDGAADEVGMNGGAAGDAAGDAGSFATEAAVDEAPQYAEDSALDADVFFSENEPFDEYSDGANADNEAAMEQKCESVNAPVQDMVLVSPDLVNVLIDGVDYIRTDDGEAPPAGQRVDSVSFTAQDGTEYWADFFGEEYLLLYRDGVCLGGYTRAD